jgi:hypothetical protein
LVIQDNILLLSDSLQKQPVIQNQTLVIQNQLSGRFLAEYESFKIARQFMATKL